jgi:hypothetical protein
VPQPRRQRLQNDPVTVAFDKDHRARYH